MARELDELRSTSLTVWRRQFKTWRGAGGPNGQPYSPKGQTQAGGALGKVEGGTRRYDKQLKSPVSFISIFAIYSIQ